jgi:hypothetical protein
MVYLKPPSVPSYMRTPLISKKTQWKARPSCVYKAHSPIEHRLTFPLDRLHLARWWGFRCHLRPPACNGTFLLIRFAMATLIRQRSQVSAMP